jgi:MFS family permease
MSDEITRTPEAKAADEESLGFLVARMSEQTSELVRSELALAKAEMAEKGKGLGIGLGMFGGAGLLALFGIGTLIAAAVLGLAEAVPGWLSALIVAVVILAAAGVVALLGRKNVSQATPALPERAIAGVKDDIATVKDGVTGGNAG